MKSWPRVTNITLGYWHDERETAQSFRNGTLHTGDLATLDEDGFIFVVDRAKDFLKCGGQRVSCRYLEDILLECDALVEAAVIGIPDEVLGEAVKAFVVPRERKTDSICEQVQLVCRQKLPPPLSPEKSRRDRLFSQEQFRQGAQRASPRTLVRCYGRLKNPSGNQACGNTGRPVRHL